MLPTPIPPELAALEVQPCEPTLPCSLVFSGLDARVAGDVEKAFAQAGYMVVSNCHNHRMDPTVPLLIPEVNPSHLSLLSHQTTSGKIVTDPNCSVMGLALALKPLYDLFGLEAVHVVTLQAISGAGYPGVPSLDILDNVIPYISGEEHKIETEPLKILGSPSEPASFKISAHCTRVPVTDGHTACLSFQLKKPATADQIIEAWKTFRSEPQTLRLPMAPEYPLHYFHEEAMPQPRLHRQLGQGMSVAIGRLRPCPLLGHKCVLLSHNTIRGAAGAAILNAELLVQKGLVRW